MTDKQDQTVASKPVAARRSITPPSIVAMGLLLWVASAAAAGLGHLALLNVQFPDRTTEIIFRYIIYAPAFAFALLSLVALILGAVRWAMFGRDVAGAPDPQRQAELIELMRSINQRLLLSETAKRIAYRSEDLRTLRQTVEQDIAHGNFDAAMVLVSELGQSYGYREESESYRDRINAARAAEQDARMAEALTELEQMIARNDFDQAVRHAAKVQRLFPESEQARDLRARVMQAREKYKQQLEREFLAASQNDDVDRALELLKTLDKYLTEEDAAPLRETARGVIGKKRDNLGVQFKIAVHDKEWTQAVRVGEQIIREFPNTRMAEEVRSMIDPLRQRAAGQLAVQTANG